MTAPFIGAHVWFHPAGTTGDELGVWDPLQPCMGLITYCHSDMSVNVLVTGPGGTIQIHQHITLVQDGETPPALESSGYVTWPPATVGQDPLGRSTPQVDQTPPPDQTA